MNASLNRFALVALTASVAACASNGQGWQGAGAEKVYDQNLEAVRATAILNNDDYFEIHKEGRIYVLADIADVKNFEATHEIALSVTRIGGGPSGETIVFGIAKPESKKKDGFGAVEMFDGKREGSNKSFYAEVYKDSRWHLFDTWAALDAFRKGNATTFADAGTTAGGEVIVASGNLEALKAKFKEIHGG